MSALWVGGGASAVPQRVLAPMGNVHLDAVMAIEAAAYAFPWTRGNFIDSLAAGYPARVLLDARGQPLGYFIAMPGVDEMHLLNITVAPAEQGRGHARFMIDALTRLCHEQCAREMWLEVRESNERARAMYLRLGFTAVGMRKGYYPAPFGRREDAVVMSLKINAAAPGANDALE
jgi:[ribosomal protein S18]-alanine N-acetyltransferase